MCADKRSADDVLQNLAGKRFNGMNIIANVLGDDNETK